jgi:hypothetical protein
MRLILALGSRLPDNPPVRLSNLMPPALSSRGRQYIRDLPRAAGLAGGACFWISLPR